jgi:hypothetical protein
MAVRFAYPCHPRLSAAKTPLFDLDAKQRGQIAKNAQMSDNQRF